MAGFLGSQAMNFLKGHCDAPTGVLTAVIRDRRLPQRGGIAFRPDHIYFFDPETGDTLTVAASACG